MPTSGDQREEFSSWIGCTQVEANALEFERAAVLRDQIKDLKEKSS